MAEPGSWLVGVAGGAMSYLGAAHRGALGSSAGSAGRVSLSQTVSAALSCSWGLAQGANAFCIEGYARSGEKKQVCASHCVSGAACWH